MNDHLNNSIWVYEILKLCGVPTDHIDTEVHSILRSYSEPHRKYHTIQHIRSMVSYWELLTQHQNMSPQINIDILLAILFHDIVYNTKWTQKLQLEDVSAQEFEAFTKRAKLHISSDRIYVIRDLIKSTATHTPIDNTYSTRAFLDADMFVLSLDRPKYIEYTKQIRDEWSHIDDTSYTRGRMNFLTDVLETPCIYYTDYMISREKIARDNMQYELMILDPANKQKDQP